MQSRRWARERSGFLAALVIVAAISGGCGIEKPQAPSWDVDLIIPLVNRTYSALEIVERMSSENIAVDSSGDLSFSLTEQLDTLYTDTLLRFDDVYSQVLRQLGDYEVTPPQPQTKSIQLADHVPLAAGEAPDTGIVVELPLNTLNTITQAEIASGQLTLTAANNTNLDFDSLTCVLQDDLGGTILTETFPGGLPAGMIGQRSHSLAGKMIYSELNLEVYFHTPGGFTGSLAGQELSVEVSFGTAITVSYATAQVEPFATDYLQVTDLDTEHQISFAELADGVLYYSVSNQLPVPAQLEVTFPEVSDGAGVLSFYVSLPAYGYSTSTIDLTGWTLTPTDNQLEAEITAAVAGSSGELVTINSSDGFLLNLSLTELRLEQAQAVIAPTEISWQPQAFAVDLPEGLDNATLAAAELAITIENRSELSGGLELVITADNGHSIVLSGPLAAGSYNQAVSSVISSAEVAQLLSPLPHGFTVTGTATVGDGFSSVNLSRLDNLTAKAMVTAPLRFVLAAETVAADIESVEIDADIRDEVDRLHAGDFIGTLTSHLPLAANVTLFLGTDSLTLYDSPELEIGPLSLAAAATDISGAVSQTATTENQVRLDGDDFQVFSNPKVYVGALLQLPGTEGDTVRVRGADYLDISGYVKLSARVGGED